MIRHQTSALVLVLVGLLAGSSCRKSPPERTPGTATEAPPQLPVVPVIEDQPSWLDESPTPSNLWEERFLSAGSDEEKIAILEDKAASGTEFLLGLTKLAVSGGSRQVSSCALSLGVQLDGHDAVELYSVVSQLDDPEVRRVGVEAIRELSTEQRLEVYSSIIESGGQDLDLVVGDLAFEASKPAFEILIEAFAYDDQGVRKQLDDATMRLVGMTFDTLEDARAWWAGSSRRFDERLNEVRRPE